MCAQLCAICAWAKAHLSGPDTGADCLALAKTNKSTHKHTQTDTHTKAGKYVSGDKNNVFAIKMMSYVKSPLRASESELTVNNLCHFYTFLSQQVFILKLRSTPELTACIWPHVLNHRRTGWLDATSARRGLFSVVDSNTDSCRHHGSAAILVRLNNENRFKSAWREHSWCILMQSLHRWVWSDGKIYIS